MQHIHLTSWLRLGTAVIICLLCTTAQQVNAARVEVAEELLVELRSEDLASGSVTEWPNRGTLGGVFTAVGNPVVEGVGDWDNVVSLDGQSYFEGPLSPPGIDGPNPTRSIEVWAYKIGINGEQTMVHWGTRGGPDGTNMAFNYGNNPDFGAVGHWGGVDMGWGGNYSPNPPVENWWYLVYTHDGTTTRLYVNGEPAGEEVTSLNTDRASFIRVGAQSDDPGTGVEAGFNFVGAIAQVRIHDGVLTPEQIQTNAQIRIQTFGTASAPTPKHGETDVLRDAPLSWYPGEHAATRNVYFGTSFDEVDSATVPTVSDLTDTTFDPGRLDFGQTYYWRVDEVNGTPDKTVFRGDVWSFTAEPYSIQIPGATIVASASSSASMSGPEKTIDGSGLDPNTGQHSTSNEDMWFSLSPDLDAWLLYEFDEVKQVDKMLLWNSNNSAEPAIGWGLNEVLIETSVDGVEWTVVPDANQLSRAPGLPTYAEPDDISFNNASAKMVKISILSNFGGFLPAYAVSEVQFYAVPVKARSPYPADQAVDVMPNDVATWRPGHEADTHRVLLSQDANAVSDGSAPSVTSSTNSLDLGSMDLSLGETYYWRVDEINEAEAVSVWAGPVWRFSTPAMVMVDDFESYNNTSPDRPFQAWLDGYGYSADEYFPNGYNGNGTGAGVGHDIWSLSSPHYNGDIMETANTAQASGQSMPLYFSGDSRTDRTFTPAQDWSVAGIESLVLYFNGDRANDAGTLYITLNGQRVDYPNASALSTGLWTQWNIDLASVGINLSQVDSMSIGVDSTGSGMVLIDQIGLYKAPPEPVASVDPGTDGLAAKYSLDGNLDETSGNGLGSGTSPLDVFYVDGLPGNGMALSLNGMDDFVELPIGGVIESADSITIACWADFSNEGGAWQRLWDFGSGEGASPYMFLCPRVNTAGPIRVAIRTATIGEQIIESPSTLPSGWQHVTVVIDNQTMTMTLYLNGSPVAEGATQVIPSDLGNTTQNYLGGSQYGADALYQGSLDELLIYTRALSEGEVRYLAGDQ